MSDQLATINIDNGIATITMDDGNSNLISPNMIAAVNAALDRAEQESKVVILTGREHIFSAGFDLKILKTGVTNSFNMLIGGFKLAYRLLAYPHPVIIACNGHAYAMGAFLVLSGDYRIGARGDFGITTNEVAIGLTMPFSGIEICRQRLAPAHFVRAAMLAEKYNPDTAVAAGFLDETVEHPELLSRASALAEVYKNLDETAHRETKLHARKHLLKTMKRAIMKDRIRFVWMGVRRLFNQ